VAAMVEGKNTNDNQAKEYFHETEKYQKKTCVPAGA
jgi:hypothetical protein